MVAAAGFDPLADGSPGDPDNLTALHRRHSHRSPADRRRQVAIDVFHFHLASQANMYAGLSWTLVNLLTRRGGHLEAVLEEMQDVSAAYGRGQPCSCASAIFHGASVGSSLTLDSVPADNAVAAGAGYRGCMEALDAMPRLEAIIQESLRLAQQSITLRKIMRPVSFEYEDGIVQLGTGMYVATLLSVTNVDSRHVSNQPPLEEFVPARYTVSVNGIILEPEVYTASEQVHLSTFGHGFHACPGQRFALCIMKIAISKLLESFELTPLFTTAEIPSASVGAIARSVNPCHVAVKPRASM